MLDMLFIGLVLTILPSKNRNIASIEDSSALNNLPDDLTEGQKNKWLLVKSFQFKVTSSNVEIKTELLQSLCDVSTLIEFVYSAENIAYAGIHPSLHHLISCNELKKNLSINSILTELDYFAIARQKPVFEPKVGQQIRAFKIYDDEPLPKQWSLSEIKITGQNNFKINSAEIEKATNQQVKFDITSSK